MSSIIYLKNACPNYVEIRDQNLIWFIFFVQVLCVTWYYTSRLSFAIVHSSELLKKMNLALVLLIA